MAHPAMKRIEETSKPQQPATRTITHSDIAALAYQLWQDRGCPDGSPEEDWYKAEEQLRDLDPPAHGELVE